MEAFKQQLTLILSLVLMLLVALPVYRKAVTQFSAMERKRIQRENPCKQTEQSQQTITDRPAFETVRFTGTPQGQSGQDTPHRGTDADPSPRPDSDPPAPSRPAVQRVQFASPQPAGEQPEKSAPAQPQNRVQPVRFVSSPSAAEQAKESTPAPRSSQPAPPAPSEKPLTRSPGRQDAITVVFAEDDDFHKKS